MTSPPDAKLEILDDPETLSRWLAGWLLDAAAACSATGTLWPFSDAAAEPATVR